MPCYIVYHFTFIADKLEDDESEEDDGDINPKKKIKLNNIKLPKFAKSSVDSEFFSVRESEHIADEDLIGRDNFEDIDFMKADSSDESEAEDIKYEDFFDDPNGDSKDNEDSGGEDEKREEADEGDMSLMKMAQYEEVDEEYSDLEEEEDDEEEGAIADGPIADGAKVGVCMILFL